MDVQAYTKDTITLKATFLDVVKAEMSGTLYEMATKDDNACKTARPNWIQNDLRKMVIAGKVEICFFFCFPIVSGNLFMVPEVALPVAKNQKQSGQCCVLVDEWASRDSCGYCPGSHQYQFTPYGYPTWSWSRGPGWVSVWGCWGSRKCS